MTFLPDGTRVAGGANKTLFVEQSPQSNSSRHHIQFMFEVQLTDHSFLRHIFNVNFTTFCKYCNYGLNVAFSWGAVFGDCSVYSYSGSGLTDNRNKVSKKRVSRKRNGYCGGDLITLRIVWTPLRVTFGGRAQFGRQNDSLKTCILCISSKAYCLFRSFCYQEQNERNAIPFISETE